MSSIEVRFLPCYRRVSRFDGSCFLSIETVSASIEVCLPVSIEVASFFSRSCVSFSAIEGFCFDRASFASIEAVSASREARLPAFIEAACFWIEAAFLFLFSKGFSRNCFCFYRSSLACVSFPVIEGFPFR